MPIYADVGVSYVWLVDPLAQTLEAYSLINRQRTLIGSYLDDAKVSVFPFAEIELQLKELWQTDVGNS